MQKNNHYLSRKILDMKIAIKLNILLLNLHCKISEASKETSYELIATRVCEVIEGN